jgi:regulator of protease activity HflC (stomatin/prohibitin superfamily)
MKKASIIWIMVVMAGFLSGCVIIRPGEVGVRRTMGKLQNKVLDEGVHGVNPFATTVIRKPIRTVNLEMELNLPSKEGLNIKSGISILYRVNKQSVPTLIKNLGNGYEQIIQSVFRSASADICAQYMAKDMHSGKRADIEREIATTMAKILDPQGITIESVLLKTIQLPPGLYNSIESRLEAEQEAMRMQYIIDLEQREAERKVIEAQGNRDAQKILSEGLTKEILELRRIEAMLKLSESPNAKVVFLNDDNAPMVIDPTK